MDRDTLDRIVNDPRNNMHPLPPAPPRNAGAYVRGYNDGRSTAYTYPDLYPDGHELRLFLARTNLQDKDAKYVEGFYKGFTEAYARRFPDAYHNAPRELKDIALRRFE